MTTSLKSTATQQHVVLKRAAAAAKKMRGKVKRGKVLKGPAPRRLKIRA